MIPEIGEFNKSFVRPSDDVSKEKKSSNEYCKAYAEYIYSQYLRRQTSIFYDYNKVKIQRDYANATQSPSRYIRQLTNSDANDVSTSVSTVDNLRSVSEDDIEFNRKHYMAVNFSNIFSIAPKVLEYILSILEDRRHDIRVKGLDKYSADLRLREKWSLWVKGQYYEWQKGIKESVGIPIEDATGILPQTMDELEYYESISGFPLNYEIFMEEALRLTSEISDLDNIKIKILRDLFTSKCASVYTAIDESTQRAKYYYVDFTDIIIKYNRENDFDNSVYAAVPVYRTISDIRSVLPNIEESELRELASMHRNKYGNASKYDMVYDENTGTYDYDDCVILVLKCWWVTLDNNYFKYEINGDKVRKSEISRGKVILDDGKYYKEKVTGSRQSVYGTNWLVGTKYTYGNGQIKDDSGKIPLHVYYMEGKSKVDIMIPLLDIMAKTYFKLEDAIAKAAPPGLFIDIEALKDVRFGKKRQHPLSLINIYNQSGHMIYSSRTNNNIPGMPDKVQSRKLIEEHSGGGSAAIMSAIQAFEASFNWMAELTGIDRVSQVSGELKGSVTATERRISAQGTIASLKMIERGWLQIYKDAANNVAKLIEIKCWDDLPSGKGYQGVLSRGAIESIREASKETPLNIGIFIKPMPTDEERVMLLQKIQDAEANGFIEPNVGLYITDNILTGQGISKAISVLNYEIARNKKRVMEENMAMEQNRSQSQAQLSQQQFELDEQVKVNDSVRSEEQKIKDFERKLEEMKVEHIYKLEEIAVSKKDINTNQK